MKFALILLALITASAANAATYTFSFTVTSPTSTSVACTPVANLPAGPLQPGTVVGNCVVTPSTWAGGVAVNGTQFVTGTISPPNFSVVVGASALPVGQYTVSGNTLP